MHFLPLLSSIRFILKLNISITIYREIIIQIYKGSINFSHLIRGSISPCGQLVFIGSEDNTVLVWKTETGIEKPIFDQRINNY
jgi:WD40 repeat protein